MSKFSGKCDFYDEICICGIDVILNAKVYVGDEKEPLVLKSLSDCVPYYPYITTASYYNSISGERVIFLTDKSWVDIEEERYGHHAMHDIYKNMLIDEIAKAESEGDNYKM
jgi:hypothetical protein